MQDSQNLISKRCSNSNLQRKKYLVTYLAHQMSLVTSLEITLNNASVHQIEQIQKLRDVLLKEIMLIVLVMVMYIMVKKQLMEFTLQLLICYLETNTSRKSSMEALLVLISQLEVILLLANQNNASLKQKLQLLQLKNALMKVVTVHVTVISFTEHLSMMISNQLTSLWTSLICHSKSLHPMDLNLSLATINKWPIMMINSLKVYINNASVMISVN
jgi:hypothetical protein